MAARRLLIVMLILLGISSVIAIVTPNPRKDATEKEASTTGDTGVTGASGASGATATTGASGSTGVNGAAKGTGSGATGTTDGRDGQTKSGSNAPASMAPVKSEIPGGVSYRITADGRAGSPELKARTGERLILTVKSRKPGEITIKGLGLLDFVDRYAAARFDVLLPEKPGRFPVIAFDGDDPSAVIVTRPATD